MREALQVAGRELPARVEPVEKGVDCELHTRGRYQICMELASGGMGTVYLALYRGVDGFERVVALKRMHPELARQKHFVEMFFDEAQALARVQHPNVCALLDLGTFDDSYFLAMDYLEGEPLSAVFNSLAHSPLLRNGERLPYVIARVFARLCDGLQAVHQTRDERGDLMNLVHCDISPQNLFVLYDGTVRLMDFGAARARSGMLHQERPGMARGKLPYMAPEQLDGKEPDLRFDIWSMGVTMWELLTGQSLFDGRTMRSIIEEVKSSRIPLASEHNSRVPPELASVVDRALLRDPEKRFGSARELSAALEQFLSEAGECVPAAEVSVWLESLFGNRAQERHKLRSMARAIGDHLMPPSVRPFGELHSAAPDGGAAASAAKTIQLNLPAFTQTQAVNVDVDMSSMSMPVPLPEPADAELADVPANKARRGGPLITAAIGAGALLLLASAARMVLLNDADARPSAELALPTAAPAPAQQTPVNAAPSSTAPAALPATPAAPPAAPPSSALAAAPLRPTAAAPETQPAAAVAPVVAAPPAPPPKAADAPAPVATAPAAAPAPQPVAAEPLKPPPAQAAASPAAAVPAVAAVAATKPAAPRTSQEKQPAAPKPAPRATPAPASSSTFVAGGSVLILTKPGPAYIFFQGRQLGRSPTRVRLPVGDHKLQLKPVAGGADVFVQIHMEEGWSSIAQVKLQ